MMISPQVSSPKPNSPSPTARPPQTSPLKSYPQDSVCFSGHENYYPMDDMSDSGEKYHKNIEHFMESNHAASKELQKQQALQKLEPVLQRLRRICIVKQFPLERELQVPTSPKAINLADFIKNHPRFESMLESEPQAFQQKLEQLAAFHEKVRRLPEFKELCQTNQYTGPYFAALILGFAAEKLMDQTLGKDSSEFNSLLSKFELGLVKANQNAKQDPSLKTEEKILQAIEAHHHNIKLLQRVLEINQNRFMVDFLSDEALAPDPQSHPLIQAAQRQIHNLAKITSPEARAVYEHNMLLGEQGFCRKLGEEQRKQPTLQRIYFNLSEHMRSKAQTGFSRSQATQHPLSHSPEFRALWRGFGGDMTQLAFPSQPNFDILFGSALDGNSPPFLPHL